MGEKFRLLHVGEKGPKRSCNNFDKTASYLYDRLIAVYGSLIASRIWKNNCSASVATIFATTVGDFSRMFYFNAGFQIIGTIAGLF